MFSFFLDILLKFYEREEKNVEWGF
jgi:hypothetical protein